MAESGSTPGDPGAVRAATSGHAAAVRLHPRDAAILAAALAAAWPVGPFLVDRWLRWEGMWVSGLLLAAALTAWGFRYLGGRSRPMATRPAPSSIWLAAAAVSFAAYAVAYPRVPRLFGHAMAVFAVACVLLALLSPERRRRSWGLVPLILLALPVMPSVQYAFGYPLRVVVAELASTWLGGSIHAVGTGLTDGHRTVFVDAPCSGLRMLSVALILGSAASLALRLSPVRTAIVLVVSGGVALLGNAGRAVALFVLEANLDLDLSHTAIGLILFAFSAGVVVVAAWALRSRVECVECAEPATAVRPRGRGARLVRGGVRIGFVLACAAALLAPLRVHDAARRGSSDLPAFAWPTTWRGVPLVRIPPAPALRRFLEDFPGRMAEFRVGDTGRRMSLRWTPFATRKLHTAEGCYRAMGSTVTPLPAVVDERGHTWSRFRALPPDGVAVVVRQAYFAIDLDPATRALDAMIAAAPSWPDASAWYWAAARPGSRVKATLAVTVTESS